MRRRTMASVVAPAAGACHSERPILPDAVQLRGDEQGAFGKQSEIRFHVLESRPAGILDPAIPARSVSLGTHRAPLAFGDEPWRPITPIADDSCKRPPPDW